MSRHMVAGFSTAAFIRVLAVAALISSANGGSVLVRNTVPDLGFYDPLSQDGGSMLTIVPGTVPAGLGEPLNVIISAKSDADVLIDRIDQGGLQTYFQSIFFGISCGGGINLGDKQSANLGDGKGYVNETAVMRYNYHDPIRGTCNETVLGGNHFRYWTQNGAAANSSAIFLAVSYELPLAQNHDIIPDGYNLGRDWLVGNATQTTFSSPNPLTSSVSNASSSTVATVPNAVYIGTTSANNFTYQTTATYVTGLLGATSVGVNHNGTVPEGGRPALDGLVAVLVVNITGRPAATTSAAIGVTVSPLIPLSVAVTLLALSALFF